MSRARSKRIPALLRIPALSKRFQIARSTQPAYFVRGSLRELRELRGSGDHHGTCVFHHILHLWNLASRHRQSAGVRRSPTQCLRHAVCRAGSRTGKSGGGSDDRSSLHAAGVGERDRLRGDCRDLPRQRMEAACTACANQPCPRRGFGRARTRPTDERPQGPGLAGTQSIGNGQQRQTLDSTWKYTASVRRSLGRCGCGVHARRTRPTDGDLRPPQPAKQRAAHAVSVFKSHAAVSVGRYSLTACAAHCAAYSCNASRARSKRFQSCEFIEHQVADHFDDVNKMVERRLSKDEKKALQNPERLEGT